MDQTCDNPQCDFTGDAEKKWITFGSFGQQVIQKPEGRMGVFFCSIPCGNFGNQVIQEGGPS